jgi:hypothetical protein
MHLREVRREDVICIQQAQDTVEFWVFMTAALNLKVS